MELSTPTVLVVRHGTTGKDTVLKGLMDVGLDSNGRSLAESVARHIAEKYPVGVINHSPLLRGSQTAYFISKATGVEAKPAKALGPMDIGWMSGMDKDEAADIMRYYIEHPDKAPRDGKPLGDWYDAFSSFMEKELAEAKKNPEKARVEVTHSSESVNIPSVLKGGDVEYRGTDTPPPGSYMLLEHRGGKWNMKEVNPRG